MGQKFAAYASNGAIVGFYDDIDSPVPSGVTAIPITADEWLAAIMTPGYTVANGALVAPAAPTKAQLLAQAQAAQAGALRAACGAAIVGGFTSSALGSAHTYPSQITDQINLMGASQAASAAPTGWTIDYWCADGTGAWSYASHTADQIKQVFADGVIVRVGLSAKLATLSAQVGAATTVAAVQAVVWA